MSEYGEFGNPRLMGFNAKDLMPLHATCWILKVNYRRQLEDKLAAVKAMLEDV